MQKPRISQTKPLTCSVSLALSSIWSPHCSLLPQYISLYIRRKHPLLILQCSFSRVPSILFRLMRTQAELFCNYFEKWMSQLEEYVQLLLTIKREKSHNQSEYQALVNKLTAHHKDYYTVKWAGAHEDVFTFFTPIWLSPLENAYLWITGWKPSMIFRLVDSLRKSQLSASAPTLTDLTEEQVKKIEGLRCRIRVEEEKVEREMERQQVAMADRKMVELARLVNLIKNGEHPASTQIDGLVEIAVKGLMVGLEKVMKMADCVRLKTLKGVLDVLNPMQSVDFLAASSMLQIQIRKWGKKRERENHCINESDRNN